MRMLAGARLNDLKQATPSCEMAPAETREGATVSDRHFPAPSSLRLCLRLPLICGPSRVYTCGYQGSSRATMMRGWPRRRIGAGDELLLLCAQRVLCQHAHRSETQYAKPTHRNACMHMDAVPYLETLETLELLPTADSTRQGFRAVISG